MSLYQASPGFGLDEAVEKRDPMECIVIWVSRILESKDEVVVWGLGIERGLGHRRLILLWSARRFNVKYYSYIAESKDN